MITSKYDKVTPVSYTESEDGTIDPILKKRGLTNTIYQKPIASPVSQIKAEPIVNPVSQVKPQPIASTIDKPKFQQPIGIPSENQSENNTDSDIDVSAGTIATGAMQGIGSVYSREKQEPLNRTARNASTLNLAAQGAQIGTSILPGWGTLIGAAAGAGYGAIKGISDAKKIKKQAQKEKVDTFNKTKAEREEAQRLQDGSISSGIYSNYNK